MKADWKEGETKENLVDLSNELRKPNKNKARENHCIIKMFVLFTFAQKKAINAVSRI